MLKLLKYTAHRTNNEEMPATRSCGFFQVPYRSIFVGQIRLNFYRIRARNGRECRLIETVNATQQWCQGMPRGALRNCHV